MEYQEFSDKLKHSVENISEQLFNAILKAALKEGKADYDGGYKDGYAKGKEETLQNLPRWKKVPQDDYSRVAVLAKCGEFGIKIIYRGQLLKAGWKYIPLRDLHILLTEEQEKETEE